MQNALFASEIRLFGTKDFCMILSDISKKLKHSMKVSNLIKLLKF